MKKRSFVQQILKENSLNESTDTRVIFMTLLPDDYHGSPMVDEFTDETMPTPPSEESVFSAWSAAGYNSYQMGGDEDSEEEEFFQLYGNGTAYYVVYLLVVNSNESLKDLKYSIDDMIGNEGSWLEGEPPAVEEVVELLSEIPSIELVLPLDVE
jgi:hypothetical protein